MNNELLNTEITDEEAEELEDILDDDTSEDSDNDDAPMNSIENVIEWINRQDTVTFTISQRKYKNRVEKLAKEYPGECRIVTRNADGSLVAKMPLTWIRISKPRVRILTEEQRQAAAEKVQRKQERKLSYE